MKFNKKQVYIVIVVVLIVVFVTSRGFRNLIKRRVEQYRLEKQIEQVAKENAGLKQEVHALEKDRSYQEYLVRKDLGYIKPDEIEYRFIKRIEKSDKIKK